MKTLITSLILIFTFGLIPAVNAQKSVDTVQIKTSAQCEQCKKRIEKGLSYEKGIKSSNLDVETKIVTVIYKAKKTSPEKIRMAISKIGYDADDVKADPKAYDKLPDCCKKGGMD